MLIALATDKNYLELAGILMRSIAKNGDVPSATIVVCADGLDAHDKSILAGCAAPLRTSFFDLDETLRQRLAHVRRTANWPLTTWARVVFPDMVAENEGRLLYLDSDIVVAKSLRPLFETDLQGAAIAGVPVDKDATFLANLNNNLGKPADTAYFNAGVLLIDIAKWREQNVTERVLEVARRLGNDLTYLDQDALNSVADGHFVMLDRKWNWYSASADPSHASIIHFVYEKPHIAGTKHPARGIYLDLRRETPWVNKRLVSPWVKRRKKWLRRVKALVPLLWFGNAQKKATDKVRAPVNAP